MGISVEVRPFQLRVISTLLIDLAAGLLLLLFTIRDIMGLLLIATLLFFIFIAKFPTKKSSKK